MGLWGAGAADSGSANGASNPSSSRGVRSGKTSRLFPVIKDKVTGTGEGHINGQRLVETARRIRCPAGNRCATSFNLIETG